LSPHPCSSRIGRWPLDGPVAHSCLLAGCVFLLCLPLSAHALEARARHGDAASQSAAPARTPQRPGYLGVSLRDLDAAEATRLQLRGAMGALIVTVDRDAPAWSAGLRPKDVVLEINGQTVADVEMLRRQLRLTAAGETVTLRVRRGDEETSFAVTMGDQSEIAQDALNRQMHSGRDATAFVDSPPSPATDAPLASRGMASTLFDALIPGSVYTGLEVEPLTPQLAAFFGAHAGSGLLVTVVNGGSPAAISGLLAGDVILRAANEQVKTSRNLARALRDAKGNAVALGVLRDHKEVILSLLPAKRRKL
jgi:serine protease Do